MKKLFLFFLLSSVVFAQTANVQKSIPTNRITAGFKVPSGQTIQFETGSTIQIDTGAISSFMVDPMTTVGDMVYRNSSNLTARLPVGSNGQIMTVVGGLPQFAAASFAPVNAPYVTTTSNGTLTGEFSLGSLTTGLLLNTVSGGTATVTTATAGTDYVAPGALTVSGLTMATAKLIGRSTASTGAPEEITIGSGLTLSAGTLTASGGGGGGDLLASNNLSDVSSGSTSLINIGGAGTYYYSIKDYASGGQLTGSTDATSAVQSALTAIETAMLANAGGKYVLDLGDAVLKIDGALQTTNGGNSQLVLPSLPVGTAAQCTLLIKGSAPVSSQYAVIGNSVIYPAKGAKIKSTLTTGGGTQPSVLSGRCSSANFSLLFLVLQNVEIQTINNPLISGLDASLISQLEISNCSVNVGTYNVDSVTTPTTTSSVGIISPGINNGALTGFHNVYAIGFYTGFRLNEHSLGDVAAFGCLVGLESSQSNHPMHLSRFMDVCCAVGLKGTGGVSRILIDDWTIEHAQSGAFTPTADVSDSSNYLTGSTKYAVVLGGTGISHTFTKSGGSNFSTVEIGGNPTTFTVLNPSAPARVFIRGTNNTSNSALQFYAKDSGGTDRTGGLFFIPSTSDAASFFSISGDSANLHLNVRGDGAIAFPTYGAGTLTTDSSGNITATSDARLKNVLGSFDRGLFSIMALHPILFKWKPESHNETESAYAGFTAQDVQSAIPEAVGHMTNGNLTLQDRPVIAALVNSVQTQQYEMGMIFASFSIFAVLILFKLNAR